MLALVLGGMLALGWALWMWRDARAAGRRTSRVMRAVAIGLVALAMLPLASLRGGVDPGGRRETTRPSASESCSFPLPPSPAASAPAVAPVDAPSG